MNTRYSSFNLGKHILFILLSGSLFSCNHNPDSEPDNIFNTTFHLNSRVLIPSSRLIDPWTLQNMDSILFVTNNRGTPVVEAYDWNGKKINSFINRGRNSENIAMIGAIQPDFARDCIYLYDLFEKKILRVSTCLIAKGMQIYPRLLMDFKTSALPLDIIDKAYIMDSTIVVSSKSPRGRLLVYNQNRGSFQEKIPYPETEKGLSDYENAELYAGQVAISPDKRKLAMATYTAGLLSLYNIDKDDFRLIWSDTSFLPKGWRRIAMADTTRIAFTNESKAGYLDICATNEFVFSVFSGKLYKEKDYSFSNIIRAVSWDGKKRYQLVVDRMINRLSVSQDNSSIFAISPNSKNEPEIVVFNIEHLLK